jgi:hypothetical protein
MHKPVEEDLHRKFDPIRLGTTHMTNHVPGYRGYMPSSKANRYRMNHGVDLKERTTFLKNNIIEN